MVSSIWQMVSTCASIFFLVFTEVANKEANARHNELETLSPLPSKQCPRAGRPRNSTRDHHKPQPPRPHPAPENSAEPCAAAGSMDWTETNQEENPKNQIFYWHSWKNPLFMSVFFPPHLFPHEVQLSLLTVLYSPVLLDNCPRMTSARPCRVAALPMQTLRRCRPFGRPSAPTAGEFKAENGETVETKLNNITCRNKSEQHNQTEYCSSSLKTR